MRDLLIIGAGGHGRETLDIVEAMNAIEPTWQFLGFLDDGAPDVERLARRGASVVGSVNDLAEFEADYVVAIGGGVARRAMHDRLSSVARPLATLVHPDAVLGGDNRIAAGVLVAAGCHVTTNVEIGAGCHVNVGSSIHHDAKLGELVTLSPRTLVNGEVTIGDDVWIGPGAVIGRGVSIGPAAVIGAGAVVLDDVEAGERVAGVPARSIRSAPPAAPSSSA